MKSNLAWHRELSLKELDDLKARAKRGSLLAVRAIASFSIWKRIDRLKIDKKEKIRAHKTLMQIVKIKVQKNGR